MTAQDIELGGRLPIRVREIAPGIHWLSSCAEIAQGDASVHIHASSAFVVVGATASMLVDVGSAPFAADTQSIVADLAGPNGLAWIFPTHLEHPHAGGLPQLAARFSDATIVCDAHDYDFYFPELLERVRHVEPGDRIDLGGGYGITFLPAVIRDLATTLWAYEESQRVMFVADGFSYSHYADEGDGDAMLHSAEECTLYLSELPGEPSLEHAAILNSAALWWTHHVPVGPLLAEFASLRERYPTHLLAPAHGGVIDDIDTFLPIVAAAGELAYAAGAQESERRPA